MDIHYNCVWKNKKFPTQCRNRKIKNQICPCDLEPCDHYIKRGLLKTLKLKIKGEL